VAAGGDVVWRPTDKWNIVGGLSFTKKQYDDFFEDVTFVEREDDQTRARISVSRILWDKVVLSGSYSYTTQDSSFFLSEYESHDGGLNVQLSKRF